MKPETLLWIHELFSHDEELLRLIFYKSKNMEDNIFDNRRKDILVGKPTETYLSGALNDEAVTRQELIKDRIKPTLKYKDLEGKEKCRITFNVGDISPSEKNKQQNNWNFTVSIFVPEGYEEKDFRTIKIINKVNYLLLSVGLARPARRLKPTLVGGSSVDLLDGYNVYQLNYNV